MCGLCGVFGTESHWTDAAGEAAVFGEQAARQPRRQERFTRVALANRVLAHYGLRVSDWQGARFIVSTRTGRSEMVEHLAALWPVAERLAGRTCDPLDPTLIAALERE
jgi:hypothetical protein